MFKIILLIAMLLSSGAQADAPVSSKHGMVVSEQHLASQVGADILRRGGNAVDAAVGVGYALAVVNPCCGNLGGGGFMLVHLASGKNLFINFREKAPLAATPNMYLDTKGEVQENLATYGYSSVAVPGTVKGLDYALKKYGTWSRQKVMAGAIELAEKGYILEAGDVAVLGKGTEGFQQSKQAAAIFLNKGQPFAVGDRLIQKDLAHTLKQIADLGPEVFYRGPIAQQIVAASQQHKGLLSLKDFSAYQIQELEPLACTYRGMRILTSPPPSSGGVALCEMLNILEAYPLTQWGRLSTQSLHYEIEAMRLAFADRNNKLGDPDFVHNPVVELTSKTYAAGLRKKILPNQATASASLRTLASQHEGEHTTHYSITDQAGNAVAVTYTINRFYGSFAIAGNTGFFLNDEMDDFASKPGSANQFGLIQGEANAIQPGKRPLSSMTPTLVMNADNTPLYVLGSPGGPRIITTVLETLLNLLDYHLDIQAAVNTPRFHQQWYPEWVELERDWHFEPETLAALMKMGYTFKTQAYWGEVEAIYRDPQTKIYYGGHDFRRGSGKAVTY